MNIWHFCPYRKKGWGERRRQWWTKWIWP